MFGLRRHEVPRLRGRYATEQLKQGKLEISLDPKGGKAWLPRFSNVLDHPASHISAGAMTTQPPQPAIGSIKP
jgi:hypothetical protein